MTILGPCQIGELQMQTQNLRKKRLKKRPHVDLSLHAHVCLPQTCTHTYYTHTHDNNIYILGAILDYLVWKLCLVHFQVRYICFSIFGNWPCSHVTLGITE